LEESSPETDEDALGACFKLEKIYYDELQAVLPHEVIGE